MAEADDAVSESQKKHRDWHDWVFTIGTVAAFCAAAAAAIFTGFAASYTRQQWITSDDTEKRQLRAYLTLKAASIGRFTVGQPLILDGTVRNFGATPAYRFFQRSLIDIVQTPQRPIFVIKDYRSNKQEFGASIYPAEDFMFQPHSSQQIVDIVSDNLARAVESGNKVIAWYGTVYYWDIFDHQWATDFCFYFRWNDIPVQRYNECINHHGADEESEGDLPK